MKALKTRRYTRKFGVFLLAAVFFLGGNSPLVGMYQEDPPREGVGPSNPHVRMNLDEALVALVIPPGRANEPSAAGESASTVQVQAPCNISEVCRLIEEGERELLNQDGRDLVIVLGTSGAGKSTTINYLLGAKMIEKEENGLGVIDVADEERNQFARIGHSKTACTALPRVWSKPDHPYVYLDTRGFLGDGSLEEDIATSILMEMAIRQSPQVKAIVIGDYNDLRGNRARHFMGLGRTLSKIVLGQQNPILFLFNRYAPSESEHSVFYQMPFSGQNDQVIHSAEKHFDLLAIHERSILETTARDFEVTSSEYKKQQKKRSYICFLEYNFKRKNIGYINPLRPDGRQAILDKIGATERIARDRLDFSECMERDKFDIDFLPYIENLLFLVKAQLELSEFSGSLLHEMATEARQSSEYHRGCLETLTQHLVPEIQYKLTGLLDVHEAFQEEIRTITARRRYIRNQLDEQREKESELQDAKTRILGEGHKVLTTKTWCEEWGLFFKWWRNYHFVYEAQADAPFVTWQEELEDGTTRHRINSAQHPKLAIDYKSSAGHACAGKVKIYALPTEEPVTKADLASKDNDLTHCIRVIKMYEKKLGKLEQEEDEILTRKNTDAAAQLLHFHQKRVNILSEQARHLEEASKVWGDVRDSYDTHRERLDTAARIIKRLQKNTSVFEEFTSLYERTGLRIEKEELDKQFVDPMFYAPLLDPVQLLCPQGNHPQVFEAHCVTEALCHEVHPSNCVYCATAETKSRIMPNSLKASEAEAMVDEIYTSTVTARSTLNKFRPLVERNSSE